jgi:GNAT superfamily N-acetyltransferase
MENAGWRRWAARWSVSDGVPAVAQPSGGYPEPARAGSFGQLAVDPAERGTGLGHRLLVFAEERLAQLGCRDVAIDTSDQADDLIAW